MHSPSNGRIDVTLLLTPVQNTFVWKGPYTVSVVIFEGAQWRGTLDSIEVAAAFLYVLFVDDDDQRLVLNGWRRRADPSTGIYYVGRLANNPLDVDHARVKEIELYLEVTAILKDGTGQRHVTQKCYRLVVLRDMESILPAA